MKEKKFAGTERGTPKRFAADGEMVSRLAVFGKSAAFTDSSGANPTFNVASGGDLAVSLGTAYDGNNILIHRIKVINEDPSNLKQVHFWSNNYTGRSTSVSQHLFRISMASTDMSDDADGKIDVVVDFPIPLLVMGGCRIGMKVSSGNNYAARVEIAYTILNSTPATASFDELKYKYLSAFAYNGDEDEPLYAIEPDSTSTEWKNDIEIWGGMIMNNKNPAGNSDGYYSQTWVQNADGATVASLSCRKGPTNAFRLNFPIWLILPTLSVGWSSFPTSISDLVGGIDFDANGIIWAENNYGTNAQTAAAVSNSTVVTLDVNSTGWLRDTIKVGDTVTGTGISGTVTVATVTNQNLISLSSAQTIDDNVKLTFSRDDRKTWALKPGGSDTEVVFFPYPIYCKGNAANTSSMRVFSTGDTDACRATWFYRPLQAKGISHGWV